MIYYEEPVIRPPAEADSLILQATIGCTHNRCTFCITYKQKKFRTRPLESIQNEIDYAATEIPHVRKVFLGDGDALGMPTDELLRLLEYLYQKLPSLKKTAVYASPGNFQNKTVRDLRLLKDAGLSLLYVGLESGDNDTLRRIKKGYTAEEMALLLEKPNEAGIKLSTTVILGLGGPQHMQRIAENTAQLIDRVQPRFASALTLMLPLGDSTYKKHWSDDWRMLTPKETLLELRCLISAVQANKIIFRSNHASNYLPIEGTFQKGKAAMLAQIDAALHQQRPLRPEFLRGL